MSQPPKNYSPFWPIQITITCILAWLGFQLFIINSQRLTLNDRLDDLQNQLETANANERRMMSLQQDLLNLAQKGDSKAQEIIKKHNLFVLGRGGRGPGSEGPQNPAPAPQGQ